MKGHVGGLRKRRYFFGEKIFSLKILLDLVFRYHTRIDYIFLDANFAKFVEKIEYKTIPTDISDHNPVSAKITFKK